MSLSTLRLKKEEPETQPDELEFNPKHDDFFDNAFTHYMTLPIPLRFWYGHPLRRVVKGSPHYATKLSTYSRDELRRFHQQIQLRLMELFPERLYNETFPPSLLPLLNSAPVGLVRRTFHGPEGFFQMLNRHIGDVKNGVSDVQLVVVRPVPPEMVYEKSEWNLFITPHCRFLYLDVQKTLFLRIAMETRYMESFARDQIGYDDSGDGVEGHALARITYSLIKQLSRMDVQNDEYEFLCLKSRKTNGIPFCPEEETKSIRSCDRMFIPQLHKSKLDANGDPWPSMVIETGPAFHDDASRWYMHYAVDWWFTQSEGATKIVLLMFFDYSQSETIVEKWVRTKQPPFHKRLAQTILMYVLDSVEGSGYTIEVFGENLVLNLASLLGRAKLPGETDIVFDKAFMQGFANGYLLAWPNIVPERCLAMNPNQEPPDDCSPASSPPPDTQESPLLTISPLNLDELD